MEHGPPKSPNTSLERISPKYIDFVFTQNPDLAQIGSKEEYLKYLETIFPDSIIKRPLMHGTKSDWFKTEAFSRHKIGESHGGPSRTGFLGKGFYFSSNMEGPAYGPYQFLSLLNVENPKYDMETDFIGREILKGLSKEESTEIVTQTLNRSINHLRETLVDLNRGVINKFGAVLPQNVDPAIYWENERLKRIEAYSSSLEKYEKALANIDQIVDEYYSYDGFITRENPNDPGEMTVRNSDQIHILGSQDDMDKFKAFVVEPNEKRRSQPS